MRYILSNGNDTYICQDASGIFLGCRAERATSFDSAYGAQVWLLKWAMEYVGEGFGVYSIEVVVKKFEE